MISKFRNCFVYDGKNAAIWSLNLIAKFNFSHLRSQNWPKCSLKRSRVIGKLKGYMVTVENNKVRISCTATRLSYLMLAVVELSLRLLSPICKLHPKDNVKDHNAHALLVSVWRLVELEIVMN